MQFFETERLVLRNVEAGDADIIVRLPQQRNLRAISARTNQGS